MSLVLPRILYPSAPATPPQPTTGSSAGGAFGALTYHIQITYNTIYGESLPSTEKSQAVASLHLPTVGPVASPSPPTYATGWNVYAGLTAGSETLQSTLSFGNTWTMPTGGLIEGVVPPNVWGTSLQFSRQPRMVPYSIREFIGKDSFSTAGLRQSIVERIDNYLEFTMEWIGAGLDVSAWDAFLASAIQRIPFDYYPDSTASTFVTYSLIENATIPYKVPGQYQTKLRFRQETTQVAIGPTTPPVNAYRLIPFTSPNPGSFKVPHGLGYLPGYYGAPLMISPGSVWFQPIPVDNIYIYLVASDVGLSGSIGVR